MKKHVITFMLIVSSLSVNAQGIKNLLSDINFDISASLSMSNCDNIYDIRKYGIAFGLDARKPILNYPNDRSTIYGLVGLHYAKRGGRITADIGDIYTYGKSLSASYIMLPVHVGYSYQFKKCSIFIDLGPQFTMMVGGEGDANDKEVELSTLEFGYSGSLGIRFKHFAFAVGSHNGLTKFGTHPNSIGEYGNGKINLKNRTEHISLIWTL